jgi:dienelactone hydrolase
MRTLPLLTTFALLAAPLWADDPSRVLSDGEKPKDARLGKLKTLNDFFPMTVPKSKQEWEARRVALREQVLVANGLWPMPEKTPLKPTIHGKIDREDYTVEKVFFASYPGHYVSGNLYRPKGKSGRLPGVLCPHGHWRNGRFFDAGEAEAQNQIKQGAEKTAEGARYPLQARCAQLARMGCVVFHYDMVGNADSKAIAHASGFADADGELRLQSAMGLQTWNSIRALDFLLSLPDIDEKRIGVTGASGGGTQTFLLCAIDDRPTAAFPAVMVSTAMQGGCVCENCSYLRVGAGNIDLAALCAPRPLGMSGAKDWTIDIETKGLPELKEVYKLLGAEDNVMAKCYPQFGHNYNQVSRELMYSWFNKHLKLGLKEPVQEKPFVPVPPAELSVFDKEHPIPADSVGVKELRQYLTTSSDRQIAALMPKDEASLKQFRDTIGTALRVMVSSRLPESSEVEATPVGDKEERDGVTLRRFLLGRKGQHEAVPAIGMRGKEFDGTVVVWVHPAGKSSLYRDGKLTVAAQAVLDGKAAILAPDVYWTGEAREAIIQVKTDPDKLRALNVTKAQLEQTIAKAGLKVTALGALNYLVSRSDTEALLRAIGNVKVGAKAEVFVRDVAVVMVRGTQYANEDFAGYTYGYNRPFLAQRVHDILTAVAHARGHDKTKKVHLVGFDAAGPWVLLARGLCGDAVARTAADVDGFRFDSVRTTDDVLMLPGALKYGGLPAFAALAVPGELLIHGVRGTGMGRWTKAVYGAANANDRLTPSGMKYSTDEVIRWLLR